MHAMQLYFLHRHNNLKKIMIIKTEARSKKKKTHTHAALQIHIPQHINIAYKAYEN